MAAGLHIRIVGETDEVRSMLAELGPKKFRRSIMIAVNTTGRQVRTYATRTVAKASGLKVGVVRRGFVLRSAGLDSLTAEVEASGYRFRLIDFNARQTGRGVAARAWGQRKTYPSTFIATMKSGLRQVFVRKSGERLPIKQLWGPGVPDTLAKDAIHTAVERDASAKLQTNIGRAIDRALRAKRGGYGPRAG